MLRRTPVDLSKPSLEGLSYILRNQQYWPNGFYWNYGNTAQCAVGLTYRFWNTDRMSKVFGISWLFGISWWRSFLLFYWITPAEKTTPAVVADRIDRYLASRN